MTKFRSTIAVLAMMVAAVLIPAVVLAATTTLYKGDAISVSMDTTLNTGQVQAGDRFTAHVIAPYPQDDIDLSNAVVSGEVVKVVPAGQGRNPQLFLAFNQLTLQDGTSYPLNVQMTGSDQKQDSRNGGHVALTTIGGMIAGNIIGKTIFHTNIGGAVGAAAGALTGYNKKSNFSIQQGAKVQLTLTRPLVVRRQAGNPQ